MAKIVNSRHAQIVMMSESEIHNVSRPHTPPYTPGRNKLPLGSRAASPVSSIHPTETISPPKKTAAKLLAENVLEGVQVEELSEIDLAYMERADLVYPGGFEEFTEDETGDIEMSDISESEEGSDFGVARKLSQLYCEDEVGEAEMRKTQKHRRWSKRHGLRPYKRSHSQSIKSDSEATDNDARDDQDLGKSARRMRRRVNGPEQSSIELMLSEEESGMPRYANSSALDDSPVQFSISNLTRAGPSTSVQGKNEMRGISTEDMMDESD